MAKIETIIPFLIYWETGVRDKKASLPELFAKARAKGVAFDPDDAGGFTVVGITMRTFRDFRRMKGMPDPEPGDLAAIGYDEWLAVLRTLFWNRWQADRIQSAGVAHMLVDWVWTSGVNGIRIPQKVLGVNPDGIVGEVTLGEVNRRNPAGLFEALRQARLDFIGSICRQRPANLKFRKGWIRRINDIRL